MFTKSKWDAKSSLEIMSGHNYVLAYVSFYLVPVWIGVCLVQTAIVDLLKHTLFCIIIRLGFGGL
jgi:hypothetical protein